MDQSKHPLAELLPQPLDTAFSAALQRMDPAVEELRLRQGQSAAVTRAGREQVLYSDGRPISVTNRLLEEVVRRAAGNSVYAVQDQLAKGYLALPGGHRLGICGTVVGEGREIRSIRSFQAINLRIARPISGVAAAPLARLREAPGAALILGPPGCGKTTLLRDLIRQISDRLGQRVGLVDERGELAACLDGSPQLPVGRLTDVISGCGKEQGIELLLRSMSPAWIAVDEITAPADVEAMVRASYCGVRFLATAHAACGADLHRRPLYRKLLETELFEYLIEIGRDRSVRTERMTYELHETDGSPAHCLLQRMGGPARCPLGPETGPPAAGPVCRAGPNGM